MPLHTEILDPHSQPSLSGCVDRRGDLVRILRQLELSNVDGRLRIATDTCSGDIFFDQGRILAAVRLADFGTVALHAILQEPGAKRFSLHPWALLERVAGDGLEWLADPGPPSDSTTSAGTHEQHPPAAETPDYVGLITSLVSDLHGRYQSPVDALEVTAVLESLGITDKVASQRYGSSDVFALAEEVHTGLRLLPSSA